MPLAQKVSKNLGLKLSPLEITVFADGEKRVRVVDNVVDIETVVVQSTAAPADANYMELFFIIDALKRSGAKSVTVVIPYLGYQRQDHVFRDGEAVSLGVVIKAIESLGASKVITFDLHTVKIPELFRIPVSHLSALPLFAEKIKKMANGSPRVEAGQLSIVNCSLVSPDLGGVRRIKLISEMLGNMPYAIIVKNRNLDSGEITAEKIEGKVFSKAVIVDDMISSGKTMVAAAELLKESGAQEIIAMATHAVLSSGSPEVLQNSIISKVFVTDTIAIPEQKKFPKLEVISVADIIAKEIRKNNS
ncbi:MAG: ribose-phosphate pyrophosphokinase [Candidatus Levybacteria bacterium]|nr:ribose-phosphate pyrophosphokinase [Candidatus Levybacteria bacterium]